MIDFIFTDLGPIAEVLLGDAIEDEAVPVVDEENDDDDDDDDRPALQVEIPMPNQQLIAENHRHEDPEQEDAVVRNFRCTCQHFNGAPCSTRYSYNDLVESRDCVKELTSGK